MKFQNKGAVKIREQFWYKLLPYLFKLLLHLLDNPTVKISLIGSDTNLGLRVTGGLTFGPKPGAIDLRVFIKE